MKGILEEVFMKRAFEIATFTSLEAKSGGPFGAVIVFEGKIISEGRNRVVETNDPTWHAEMDAIRNASQVMQTFKLKGCILYSSSEPCPMCLSACYWAGIEGVYYGSTVADAKLYGGFDDSFIYQELCLPPEQRKIPSIHCMRDQMLPVWRAYSDLQDRIQY